LRENEGGLFYVVSWEGDFLKGHDDTYSNKSWCEREMCNYLDWELTVDDPILSTFEKMVR
jgi:hypothetical protein